MRDILDSVAPAAARISKTSTQTLTANTSEQQITFDREDFDTNGSIVNLASDSLVAQEPGIHWVQFHIQFDTAAAGADGYGIIRVNGGIKPVLSRSSSTAQAARTLKVIDLVSLAAGDVLTAFVNPNSVAAEIRGSANLHISTALMIARFGLPV